jgi:hypothetical protein
MVAEYILEYCASLFFSVSTGFVDRLYLTHNPDYNLSVASFGIYSWTLHAHRLVALGRCVKKLVVYYSWSYFTMLVVTGLFVER